MDRPARQQMPEKTQDKREQPKGRLALSSGNKFGHSATPLTGIGLLPHLVTDTNARVAGLLVSVTGYDEQSVARRGDVARMG